MRIEDAPLVLGKLALIGVHVPDHVHPPVFPESQIWPPIHIGRMNRTRFGIDLDRSAESFSLIGGGNVEGVLTGNIRNMDRSISVDLSVRNLAVIGNAGNPNSFGPKAGERSERRKNHEQRNGENCFQASLHRWTAIAKSGIASETFCFNRCFIGLRIAYLLFIL